MYGDNFITRFKDYISDMFERREHENSLNMTAEIMKVDMQIKYPDN